MQAAPHPKQIQGGGGNFRAMFLGMSVVAAGYTAFIWNLNRMRTKSELKSGTASWVHTYKQHGEPYDMNALQVVRSVPSTRAAPKAPVKEHHIGHRALSSEAGKLEAGMLYPAPQRSRGDGSDGVYTKSPSFVDGYEKTPKHWRAKAEARKTAKEIQEVLA